MKTGTILIVDDCEIQRTVLEAFLTAPDLRYDLHFAETGGEALRKAHELTPDLILLDVMMPELDGFEVCQRLRADGSIGEIPVVMLTALEDTASKVRGFASGCDEFVSKPIRCDELRARVANITRLNRFRLLLKQRSRMEWVLDNAGDGFVLVDSVGHTLYANARARQMLSLPAQPTCFLTHVRSLFECAPNEAWEDWDRDPEELLYLLKPETSKSPACWLQVNAFADARSGERTVRLRDVTDSVTERMNAWSLRSTVSHKLRTPLFKLTAGLSLVKKLQGPPELEQRLKEAGIDQLRQSIESVLATLNSEQTLTADRLPAAQLVPLLQEVAADFRSLSLDCPSSDGVEGKVGLSRQGLRTALHALLENLIRLHRGSVPSLSVSLVAQPDGFELNLDGPSIALPPGQSWQALLPYDQAGETQGGHLPGTLGLSNVAALLWAVGGDLSLLPLQPGLRLRLRLPR